MREEDDSNMPQYQKKKVGDMRVEKKILQNENMFLSGQNEKIQTEFQKLHSKIMKLEKEKTEWRKNAEEYLKELIFYKEKCQVEVNQTISKNNEGFSKSYEV